MRCRMNKCENGLISTFVNDNDMILDTGADLFEERLHLSMTPKCPSALPPLPCLVDLPPLVTCAQKKGCIL